MDKREANIFFEAIKISLPAFSVPQTMRPRIL